MADYQLTETDATVIRTADGAYIPNNMDNRDWVEYQAWLEAGGVPDPYVPPEPVPPVPTSEQQILFDHENRLLAMEGKAPLTLQDLFDKMTK